MTGFSNALRAFLFVITLTAGIAWLSPGAAAQQEPELQIESGKRFLEHEEATRPRHGHFAHDEFRHGPPDVVRHPPGPSTMMGPGMGRRVVPIRHVSVDEVRHFLEHRLTMMGFDGLRVGAVEEIDDERIIAEIVTADGTLVQEITIDRHSGLIEEAN